MKRLKNVFIALILFSLTTQLLYCDEYELKKENIISTAENILKEQYENANYVIVYQKESVLFEESGKQKSTTEIYIKILDEKGREDNSTIVYTYDKNYGKSELKKLEVISVNGSIREIDIAANRSEQSSTEGSSSNIYDSSEILVSVKIPGLKIGDIVHYISEESIHKPRIENQFSYFILGEMGQPIINYEIEIKGPSSKPLKKNEILNKIEGKYSYSERKEGDKTVYSLKFKDVPQMVREVNMPSILNVAMRWIVSTVDSWEDISKWYYELCEPKIVINDRIKRKAEELTAGKKSEKDKIMEIFYFVSRKIRYTGLTNEENRPGLEPHSSDYTFDTMTGVCRDKAALMTAMLRSIGFDANMVLMNASRKLDVEVPLTYFNHAIAGVTLKNKEIILLDPTDETTNVPLPQYLADKSYLIAQKEGSLLKTTDVMNGKENGIVINNRAEYKNGKVVCKSILEFKGLNDNSYRGFFAELNKKEIKEFIESRIKLIYQGVQLNSYKVIPQDLLSSGENLKIEMEFSADSGMVVGDGEYKLINLPKISSIFGVYNAAVKGASLKDRKYPFVMRFTSAVEEKTEFIYSKNIRIESIPEKIEIISDKYEYKTEYKSDKNKIIFTKEASYNALEYSTKEYDALKNILKEIEKGERKRVIIKEM
jgi:hypothetical protein